MDAGSGGWSDDSCGRGDSSSEGMESMTMWKWIVKADAVMLRLAWLPSLVLVLAVGVVLAQAADRKPPFQVLSVEPAFARPGEVVVIKAKVWRDKARDCSATMSRSIFDSTLVRYDYPISHFSDDLIDKMEEQTPGLLRVALVVSEQATPGPADLVSVLSYRCNRVHAWWPIEVTTHMGFEVLPPK